MKHHRPGYRRIPMNQQMIDILDEQKERFRQKFGRDPRPARGPQIELWWPSRSGRRESAVATSKDHQSTRHIVDMSINKSSPSTAFHQRLGLEAIRTPGNQLLDYP
jgi:hypothetical protein